MISLSYSCSCGWHSPVLDAAQFHANTMEHEVRVFGKITAQPTAKKSPEAIAREAEDRLRKTEIMRIARDRGLLVQGKLVAR